MCESHCLVRRTKPLALAGVEAVLAGKPVSLTAFDHRRIRAFIDDTIARRPIDAIFVFSGQMGQYIPESFGGRVVIDLCDVDSAKFEAYGKKNSARAIIDRREGRILAREEERLAHRVDTVILISDNEAGLLASRMNTQPARTSAQSGTDRYGDLRPGANGNPPGAGEGNGPNLVFTGQMDYPPNVDAALRMIDDILPRIRERHPHAVFHCVGRGRSLH